MLSDSFLRPALGLSFLAMSAWALLPDQLDQNPTRLSCPRGAFTTSLIAFFLAEIGDKTQVATVALAAVYPSLPVVVLGTTLGMMAANAPVVLFGESLARVVPLRAVRFVAAAIFAVLGTLALPGFGGFGRESEIRRFHSISEAFSILDPQSVRDRSGSPRGYGSARYLRSR